jgi:nitrate/nitrite-specific signal transduction histidine kinase
MANENNSSKETLEFIKNDFSQCFQQMRHFLNPI